MHDIFCGLPLFQHKEHSTSKTRRASQVVSKVNEKLSVVARYTKSSFLLTADARFYKLHCFSSEKTILLESTVRFSCWKGGRYLLRCSPSYDDVMDLSV